MPRIDERSTLVLAIVLNVVVWASITLCRTYIDVLFLSTYDIHLLPHFFMAQTVVILVITLAISPLAAKGSRRINLSIFAIAGLSAFAGNLLLRAEIPGFPFAFSLWLAAIPVVFLGISQNAIADAFDIRSFKRSMMWINVAGNLGGLAMGIAIPFIISYFDTDFLLYLLAACAGLGAACALLLRTVPSATRRYAHGQSPFNYPLFRYVALATFLMMIVDTAADYALKSELSQTFDTKAEIGAFMGPFYGLSNVLMLALQLAGTQTLLKLVGVAGMLAVIPWFCGLTSLGLLMWPSLWMAAAMRFGEHVFRFGFFSVAREIAMKPLPAQIRRSSKFLTTAIGYLGAGLGSILLWLFAERFGLQAVAVLIAVTSLAWILVTRKIARAYQGTLEEAIRIKRFSLYEDSLANNTSPSDQQNLLNVIGLALQDPDPDTVRFGFSLLEKVKGTQVPASAYPHLSSPQYDLRMDFVRAANRLGDSQTVPLLLARLAVEEDGMVIWWLLKTLAHLAPTEIVGLAIGWLHSPLPLARAGAVVVLMRHGTLDHLIVAANMLKNMVSSPDPFMRKGAAYAISALNTGNFEKELHALLQDTAETVSIAAMWAIADQHNAHLIPALTQKLGRGRASHYASRTLLSLGEPVVPELSRVIEAGQQTAVRAAVRILAAIRGEVADQAIAQAARNGSILTRSFLARACAMRAKRHHNGSILTRQAHQSVLDEAAMIRLLKAAILAAALSDAVRRELIQRRRMAEARLLYWFDVMTQTADLSGVIPALLHENTSPEIAARHATALEFLESQTKNPALRKAISVFEEVPDDTAIQQAMAGLAGLQDVWLDRVLAFSTTYHPGATPMEITEKVMLLRKVKLFADLPGETLLTIAETCEDREFLTGEKLFAKGDPPNGMYIVASGRIGIQKTGVLLAELGEYAFFGELGLFDDSPRMADAVALSDGMVLFLQKEVFDGITEDLPEVLRALVKTVIGYLNR